MPAIHVCSLQRLHETAAAIDAGRVVTLINADTKVERPDGIAAEDHLFLGFNDIVEPTAGLMPPARSHVETLIDFAGSWHQSRPLLIHCYAGISRSTAGAYIAVCALEPDRDEEDLAQELRRLAPSATPNIRLVRFADEILGRSGRMVAAIEAIGRGRDAFEGTPFGLALRRPQSKPAQP